MEATNSIKREASHCLHDSIEGRLFKGLLWTELLLVSSTKPLRLFIPDIIVEKVLKIHRDLSPMSLKILERFYELKFIAILNEFYFILNWK